MKKYKVTRTWYIEAEKSTDVLYKANERVCDEVNVQCLENQFSGDSGFGGADLESTTQTLLDLLKRIKERKDKEYHYAVHEFTYSPDVFKTLVRQVDLIDDLIAILKEIK